MPLLFFYRYPDIIPKAHSSKIRSGPFKYTTYVNSDITLHSFISKQYRNFLSDENRIRRHRAIICFHMHTRSRRFTKRRSKCRMRSVIWLHMADTFHLYHEKQGCLQTTFNCLLQFFDVLHPSLCRSLRKTPNAVFFQRNALDFHQMQALTCLQTKIQSGCTIGIFPADPCHIREEIAGCHTLHK